MRVKVGTMSEFYKKRVGGIGGEAPDVSEAKRMFCLLLDRQGCWVRPCVEGEALGIHGQSRGSW